MSSIGVTAFSVILCLCTGCNKGVTQPNHEGTPQSSEADQAINLVRNYHVVRGDSEKSPETIEESVKIHVDTLAKANKTWARYYGWRAEPLEEKPGVYEVFFDFEVGFDIEDSSNRTPTKKTAIFKCDVSAQQVSCSNRLAEVTAWMPAY
jgi:hypothetical protein